MAADLELVVDPADEDDLTIRPQLDQIAGPVGPGIPIGQGQRDEALRRQFRPSEIAQRQRVADQMKLAGFAPCRELPGGIDDGGAHAGQRQSDRNLFAAGTGAIGAADDRGGGDYRGLGRTIGVEERHGGTRCALPAEDRFRQGRLAADDDRPHGGRQSARFGGNRVGQFLPERGGQIENRDSVACYRLHETRQRLHHVFGPHHQGGSGAQRQEDFLDAGVEMQRRELQRAVAGFDPIALGRSGDEMGERAAPDHDPVGLAGRAGGIDDIGRVRVSGRDRRHRPVNRSRAVQQQDFRAALVGHGQTRMAFQRDQQGRLGIPQDGGNPGFRAVGVERQPGRPGEQRSQDGGDGVQAARQQECHEPARPRSLFDQAGGDAPGLIGQLTIGHAAVAVDQRHRVRALLGMGHDEIGDRMGRAGQGAAVQYGARRLLRNRRSVSDGPFGRSDRGVQEIQEAVLAIGQRRGVIARGVGVEVDAQPVAVAPRIGRDAQILHRPRRQVVSDGGMPGETQMVVERHDVDDGTEQPALAVQQFPVAADLFVPVALMRTGPADLLRDLGHQLEQAEVRVYRQPQRHDVHDHAGDPQGRRAQPPHDRHPEHDIRRPGFAGAGRPP